MSRHDYKDAVYYIGPEVEHTKAFSMKTLYVIGVRNQEQVVEFATEHKCKHIRLGCFGSFQKNKRLIDKIELCMDSGFTTTLEAPSSAYEWLLENLRENIVASKDFILVLSVDVPSIDNGFTNLTLKISDPNEDKTNMGTWTYPKSELMDSNRFTSWEDHMTNEIIWTEADQKKLVNDRKNAKRK